MPATARVAEASAGGFRLWLWRQVIAPNPYMASSVNRRTTNGGRFFLLPRRYNRTALDRLAYGCRGLSHHGVSVKLHQTLIQGSAALVRGPRRLRDQPPTPKKLIRTPTRWGTCGTTSPTSLP